MGEIWEYIQDDWRYRLPNKWKNNRYKGLSRNCYALLCLLYYLLKDAMIFYVAFVLVIYKFLLWDIWKAMFQFPKREWYKRFTSWHERESAVGKLRPERMKRYGKWCVSAMFGLCVIQAMNPELIRSSGLMGISSLLLFIGGVLLVYADIRQCKYSDGIDDYDETDDTEHDELDVKCKYQTEIKEESVVEEKGRFVDAVEVEVAGDTPCSLDELSGAEFEQYCAELLSRKGYTNVRVTSVSGDHGIDILAEKDEMKWGFQCKRYSQPVGNSAVREAFAGKAFYHCDVAVVITTSAFTRKAQEYASETGVLLWGKDKLEKFMGKTETSAQEVKKEAVCIESSHMTVDQKVIIVVEEIVAEFGAGNRIMDIQELFQVLQDKYQLTREHVIISDYCYNRINKGINPTKKPMLFEHLERGKYRCLGENYPYNGKVYHKDKIVGVCENGVRKIDKDKMS